MTQDFIVIGGGIAGISAAARLADLGRVTVIEAEEALGYHASGRSAALFLETYGSPAVRALSIASRKHLMDAHGGVLSPRGLMIVAGTDQEEDYAHESVDMGGQTLTIDEARDKMPILDPTQVTQACFNPDVWDVDTDRLIQNFARDTRANGRIITGARVEAITRTASGWRVTAKGETHEAAVLVNAAGAWVDQIAAMAGIAPLGFTPLRRSMARLPAPGGRDVSSWPMVFCAGDTWYAKPDAGALLVSPSEEELAEPHDAWADDMVLAEGLARYEDMVTEEITRLISNWAGLRTFAPDRNLVLGPAPQDPAFIWCAGQGGYGFQTAPGASRLLADLVNGRPSELPQEVVMATSAGRFG